MSLLLLESDSSSNEDNVQISRNVELSQPNKISHELQRYLEHHDGIAPKNAFRLINFVKTQSDLKILSYVQARRAIDQYNGKHIESNKPQKPSQNIVRNSQKQFPVPEHKERLLDDVCIASVPLRLVSVQTTETKPDHTVSNTLHYFTKYTTLQMLILLASLIFCVFWITEIVFCLIRYDISSKYCDQYSTSCDKGIKPHCCDMHDDTNNNDLYQTPVCYKGEIGSFQCHTANYYILNYYCDDDSTSCGDNYVVSCCNDAQYKHQCFHTDSLNECVILKKTVAPFVMQLLLIPVILFYIFLIYQALKRKGIIIYEEKNNSNPQGKCKLFCKRIVDKILTFKAKLESKRIDCRPKGFDSYYKDNPIELLLDAFIRTAMFKLVMDVPIIIWNYWSGGALFVTATTMLVTDALVIADAMICRPCYKKMVRCQCGCKACNPTPKQHVEYVNIVTRIMLRQFLWMKAAAVSQMIAPIIEDNYTELHAWSLYLNFAMGVIKWVSLLKLGWDYCLLLRYWQRDSVNQYECHKMNKILESMFIGAVIFKISISDDDRFITVKHQDTAKTVYENNLTEFYDFYMVLILLVSGFILVFATYALNTM